MLLFVDGNKTHVHRDGQSLREATGHVVQSIRDDGRFVRVVTVNGNEVTVGDLLEQDVTESDEISIVTCSLDELIEDTMASAQDYTPKLLGAFADSTRLFRTGNIGEASGIFSDAVPGVQWTYDVLRDLASFHPGPSPVHELFEQAGSVIPQLLQAWDTQDYVLVADIVDYELTPFLEKWVYVTEMFDSQIKAEKLKQGLYRQ